MEMEQFWNGLLDRATTLGLKILAALVVLMIGHYIIKLVVRRMGKSRISKEGDPTVIRILQNFTRIGLYVLLIVSVVAILGVPMASLVTVIASAGVAIGLALQGALSNLAGGVMILIFRPFRLGDFVEVDDYSGTVTDIGIFYTVLTTTDNKVVTVPNGTVMGDSIVNYSVKDTRRVELVFSAAYGTDAEKVKKLLLAEADKHELVLKDPAPFARLTKQNDSSLDFTLRVWTKSSDYWTVQFDLLETLTHRFEEEGIEVPFNQLDVHITKQ